MTSNPERTPPALAAELYLLLLASGHLLYVPVFGALATASDVALLLLLVVTAFDVLSRPGLPSRLAGALRGQDVPGMPGARYLRGVAVLVLFGGWIAASGAWGFHTRYALAKGSGVAALALGAAAVALSGLDRRRAADAWLTGTALALALTLVAALSGPGVFRDRVIYSAGGVMGLPFPRISGPLLHPNMMGDYLLVSGVLLWGRWPELRASRPWLAAALAGVLGVALFLTVSTAWIACGVVLMALGRAERRPGLRAAGALLAAATLVATLVPLDFTLAGAHVASSGIRPQIWKASLYPILEAPVLGVGASPYLAEALDPLTGSLRLWDAHDVYLSVLGQFGLVGLALAVTGALLVLGGARRAWAAAADARMSRALRLAWVAVAVNAVFLASEDLRHVWVLLGLTGIPLAAAGPPADAPTPDVSTS